MAQLKEYHHVLFYNLSHRINSFKKACISILKIDNKYINQKKITVDDLVYIALYFNNIIFFISFQISVKRKIYI